MNIKKIVYLILLSSLLVPLCGCLVAYEAAMLGNLASDAIGGMEKKSVNAAVSPGVTKGQLEQIKRVAFIFGDNNPTAEALNSGGLTDIMADNMAIEMMKLGYECVEKEKLKKSLEDQGLKINGALDLENAIKAGKNLGVHAIITGNVTSSASYKSSAGLISSKVTSGVQVQSATLKIIGPETGDTFMVVSINYKHGQNVDKAAKSMAQIIKDKLENPFGKEAKK
jgi:hypothetical protein